MDAVSHANRDIVFDFIRCVAAFCVILIHVSADYLVDQTVELSKLAVPCALNCFAHSFVPLFFMISGRFLLEPAYVCSINKILKKIMRLLIALYFWSFLYVVLYYFQSELRTVAPKEQIAVVVTRFVIGEHHFWFLWAIIGLYLATPVLRVIVHNKQVCRWFVMLLVGFQIVLPIVRLMPHVGAIVGSITDKINLQFAMGYTCYFVMGYYLYNVHNRISAGIKSAIYIAGLLSVVTIIVMTIEKSSQVGALDSSFLDYLHPLLMIPSISLYCFLVTSSKLLQGKEQHRIISIISSCSFGIYLSHVFVLKLLRFALSAEWRCSTWIILAESILILIICTALIDAIRRAPYIGKYIT